MSLTTPKSILIGSVLIASAILYKGESLFVAEARAELRAYDLREIEKHLSGIRIELSQIKSSVRGDLRSLFD